MPGHNGYLGPAGIFSTDNIQSDMMQIEAEQFDPNEFDDDEYRDQDVDRFGNFYPTVNISLEVVGCCLENPDWYDFHYILESQLDVFEVQMRERHRKDCPCGHSENFRFTRLGK